ncbi:unnamed protein product [Fraxinus pennsylvanica]|uniref:Trichome birefringence-like N-terminal domain-containing protein n=1 Tax=Fraxinus pennsylvanica TaxID=56036 RepID=A0AAD1YZ38_9LAMI|nr:unnamed protein product [Fraxinus pennsylvanica]
MGHPLHSSFTFRNSPELEPKGIHGIGSGCIWVTSSACHPSAHLLGFLDTGTRRYFVAGGFYVERGTNMSSPESICPCGRASAAVGIVKCQSHRVYPGMARLNIRAVLGLTYNFYLLYYPPRSTINYTTNIIQEYNQTTIFIQPYKNESRSCNLFEGQWILDERGSLYTNFSCTTIPYKRNCFLNGREDRDFLHWRWKPDQCELPRFSPKTFLSTVRGKTMAFVGDSIARNQMESLLCLLSTVETPKEVYKDTENQFTTWEFSKHNFTLMALWSQFLVTATERVVNGSTTGGFDLQLDKVDQNWSEKLHLMDYVIFSDAHWFFRQNYLYESDNLIGCVYCQATNVTDLGPEVMVIRPDGHPGIYWGNQWMKGYSDCIHWCLPGPIDTWNELLLEMIQR